MSKFDQESMEDADDLGLKAVMGKKFRDCTQGGDGGSRDGILRCAQNDKKSEEDGGTSGCKRPTGAEKVMDARWEYAEENGLDKLRKMVKGTITPALLCWFFFWCQQTEQMVSDTAVCAMFVCVGVVFFRLGRVAK